MIPHYLSLTNFLSYRQTAELDLHGVHLACISGLNGAGKSSILDAITWSLFGKSRTGDDNVVNRIAAGNGKAAEVSFVFELEGAVYRVTRRKALNKTTQLELHVRGDDPTRWRALTEASVRETQRAIERLLRMEYEIFTNASFLLQGKADEFTTKTPNRRKEILAEILGVSRWDGYKTLAADRRKAAEADDKLLERRLDDIEAELSQEAARRLELELAAAREAAVSTQLAVQDALVMELRHNRALVEQQRQALAQTKTDLERTRAERERLERNADQRRVELESHRALLEHAADIRAAYADYQAVAGAVAGWQERADQANELERERHPLEMTIANARAQLEQRLQTLTMQEAEASAAAAEREVLAADLDERRARLDEVTRQVADLEQRAADRQRTYDRLQSLRYERSLLKQERDQLAARAEEAELRRKEREMVAASQAATRAGLESALASLGELDEQQRALEALRIEFAGLGVELQAMKAEGKELAGRIERFEAQPGGDCPACGQPLTEEHRETMLQEWRIQRDAMRSRYGDALVRQRTLTEKETALTSALHRRPQLEKARDSQQATLAHYTAQLTMIDGVLSAWESDGQHQRLAELEAQLAAGDEITALEAEVERLRPVAEDARQKNRELQLLMADIRGLETRCEQLDRATSEWATTGRAAMEAARRDLEEERYASDARSALAAVDARLAMVGYDGAAHADARRRLEEQRAAPEAYQMLQQAEAAIKPLADGLGELERAAEGASVREGELLARHEELTATLGALQAGVADLRDAEAELARLREEQAAAIRAGSAARQRVEVLAEQRRLRKELQQEKQTLAGRIALLRQLEEACGRNGVQALLIETALPEIQDHANDLLARLSGGEMTIRFDTQRDRKSDGGQIETLDIKIADNSGERPYENYSGGEKFRVNFAIRLALSQVLARRAGARLRMLVIDEGFGSQDPEGRQRLVEAINEVQAEFDCILVITHIDELRDKFPARIEVEKTASGSQLQLVAA